MLPFFLFLAPATGAGPLRTRGPVLQHGAHPSKNWPWGPLMIRAELIWLRKPPPIIVHSLNTPRPSIIGGP